MNSPRQRRFLWFWGGLVLINLVLAIVFLRPGLNKSTVEELTVYCAAGIRKPAEELARQYEQEYPVVIRLDYGSSGEMESKLDLDRQSGVSRCDLYLPADQSFSKRAHQRGLTRESIPLARFRLVLATKPGNPSNIQTLDDLLSGKIDYVFCAEQAAAGKKTREVFGALGLWDSLDRGKKATFPRVPEAAQAIKISDNIQAGLIWDSTARQFGLEIVELKQLDSGRATITANVVADTPRAQAALRFGRYLSSPENGAPVFAKHHYETIKGDRWSETPEITVYCGGLNRHAVKQTLAEFEEREGCRINTLYAGCGTLVANMKTGHAGMPDAFLTCDASYLEKVKNAFDPASDMSSTRVVLLVRPGNPHNIQSLQDLAQPDLKIGTTDQRLSTLGDLSWQMFELTGVLAAIERHKTVVVTTPTAHELILQMQGHTKLDVALVYEANCQNLGEQFEVIAIDHPRAIAVQNVALAKRSDYPLLAGRLLETLTSEASRQRFVSHGFSWLAKAQVP